MKLLGKREDLKNIFSSRCRNLKPEDLKKLWLPWCWLRGSVLFYLCWWQVCDIGDLFLHRHVKQRYHCHHILDSLSLTVMLLTWVWTIPYGVEMLVPEFNVRPCRQKPPCTLPIYFVSNICHQYQFP